MKLALFDFDGTITTHDSFRDFLIFSFGKVKFLIGIFCLTPILVTYLLKLVPNWIAKQRVIKWFFEGMSEEQINDLGKKFAIQKLPQIVKKSALEKLNWHLEQGHRVIVVSASMEVYLKYWCENHKIEIIGTKLELVNGVVTGQFVGKNCWGIEKVNRIKELVKLEDYDYIYAYGDSRGDKEMLKIANESSFRKFQ